LSFIILCLSCLLVCYILYYTVYNLKFNTRINHTLSNHEMLSTYFGVEASTYFGVETSTYFGVEASTNRIVIVFHVVGYPFVRRGGLGSFIPVEPRHIFMHSKIPHIIRKLNNIINIDSTFVYCTSIYVNYGRII
jgi:hypothetical protein